MSVTVRFPDFPDVPDLATDHFGEGYWLVDIDNWFSGVGARVDNDPRPDGDGDFEQDEVFGEARFPIVTGRLAFADEQALFAARAPFAKLGAHRGPFTLEVETPEGVRTAEVIRNGKIDWDMSNAPFVVEFEIPLKAADPRKYGPQQSQFTGLPVSGGGVVSPVTSPFTQIGGGNPGRVELTNPGATDTSPEFTVTGGLSGGFELIRIETGERIRLEWPLLLGDSVVVDPGEGQVWLNDQSPVSGYLTRAEWWALGPGETATVQFVGLGTVTGAPTLTAKWREADA